MSCHPHLKASSPAGERSGLGRVSDLQSLSRSVSNRHRLSPSSLSARKKRPSGRGAGLVEERFWGRDRGSALGIAGWGSTGEVVVGEEKEDGKERRRGGKGGRRI